jgi:hypothetical protein
MQHNGSVPQLACANVCFIVHSKHNYVSIALNMLHRRHWAGGNVLLITTAKRIALHIATAAREAVFLTAAAAAVGQLVPRAILRGSGFTAAAAAAVCEAKSKAALC